MAEANRVCEISVAMFSSIKEGKGDAAPSLVDVQFVEKKTSRILSHEPDR
jgi:hypothetical protein